MNLYVGQPLERSEDARLLQGQGSFVDDIVRPEMLHAAILRSDVPHGRIRTIEVSDASRIPGVVAIVTGRDLGPLAPIPIRLAPIEGFDRFLQPPIAIDKVRYVGEPIAVVIAQTRYIAEDALDAIAVEIEALGPVLDRETAHGAKSLLFEANETNVAAHYTVSMGDAEGAFATADYTRRERFRCHRHTAAPMETRGMVAEWNAAAGHMDVWGSTKVPWFNRRALAAMLDVREDAIDMHEADVGGGFGVRGEFYPEDVLIPLVARRLGRPVKWIEDRREHLLSTNHSREIECELEIACRRDGTLLGMRGQVFGDMGAYIRTNGGVVPAKAAQFLPGPYRIPNMEFGVEFFVTNKTPTATYRAPGRFESNFFRERLFDMAAADLGVDPVDFRRKNLITEAELPYSLGRLVPYETETHYDTGDYPLAFERALVEIGYEGLRELQGREVDGRRHGIGLACFVESSGAGPKEFARLALTEGGGIDVFVGCTSLGQGHETVFAQIAADALGLPYDVFRVFRGSTVHLPEGFGTYHSRAVVMGGSAILAAAETFVAELCGFAATLLGRDPQEVAWRDGTLAAGDGAPSVSLETLAAEAARQGKILEASGSFSNTVRTYTYGTHAAHVAVDPATGRVEILDFVSVEDIGRAVNPALVHEQAIGGIVQGLGGAFLDEIIYSDEGQPLTVSFADYLLPTASDFPNVRSVTLELKRSPSNPLGVKGAGEGGIVAVAGAVANAVAAALAPLGVNVTELPLSPPKIWALIHEGSAGTNP
jgi:carbon-monoxide dehydrogenase large subunit